MLSPSSLIPNGLPCPMLPVLTSSLLNNIIAPKRSGPKGPSDNFKSPVAGISAAQAFDATSVPPEFNKIWPPPNATVAPVILAIPPALIAVFPEEEISTFEPVDWSAADATLRNSILPKASALKSPPGLN